MKNKIIIDAAVITKNHESFIEESIDSLLNQSHPINKINIVDDGSTDATYLKLFKLTKKFKKINLIQNKKSLGPSQASNQALKNLNGDFVLYTSGDDISLPERAEIQSDLLLENPKINCVINHIELLIQNKKISEVNIPKFNLTKNTGKKLFYELFWQQNFLNASAACFRNFSKINFDRNLTHLQDYKLWLQLSVRDKIITNQHVVLKYRVSDTSLSQQVNKSRNIMQKNYEELFSIYFEILSKMSLDDLNSTFLPFISIFKNSKNKIVEKKELIYFLLLSHNNSHINLKIFELLNSRTKESHPFKKFLDKYFLYDGSIFNHNHTEKLKHDF